MNLTSGCFVFITWSIKVGTLLHKLTETDLAGRERAVAPLAFRALVELSSQTLEADGRRYALAPGMQVIAEIHLGTRSVLEYLLSPVQKAFQEAGRER